MNIESIIRSKLKEKYVPKDFNDELCKFIKLKQLYLSWKKYISELSDISKESKLPLDWFIKQ